MTKNKIKEKLLNISSTHKQIHISDIEKKVLENKKIKKKHSKSLN